MKRLNKIWHNTIKSKNEIVQTNGVKIRLNPNLEKRFHFLHFLTNFYSLLGLNGILPKEKCVFPKEIRSVIIAFEYKRYKYFLECE